MKINQIAIQLYTLRDFCKDRLEFTKTIKKIREIGYQNVELAGAPPLPENEITQILHDEDVSIISSHESPKNILEKPEWVVDRLNKLGCTYAAYPFPEGIDLQSSDAIQQLANNLASSADFLKKNGKILCYHHHALEFERLHSRFIIDILLDAAPSLQAELDTFWLQTGGVNPIEWCRRLKNRVPVLHLKDYGINPENHQPIFREIGSGNLDFKNIIHAAKQSGCQWFIVEQDVCPRDPFDSIKKSFDYIQSHLISD